MRECPTRRSRTQAAGLLSEKNEGKCTDFEKDGDKLIEIDVNAICKKIQLLMLIMKM